MFPRVRRLFTSSGNNYPYVVARVRALKTYLLGESEYPKLIARDVHEIARSLEEGQYKKEVNELGSRYSGAQLIERATRLNLGRQFGDILSWCNGEPEDLLRLYFQRYDVHNVKTVLRGVQAGADPDQIRSALIPAGTVDEQRYMAGLNAETLEDAIIALEGTPYGREIANMKGARLPAIENALDQAYYRNLLTAAPERDRPTKAFTGFLKREVDITNLKLVFCARHANVRDYELVPGGSQVTDELAARIAAADASELQGILAETHFGDTLRDAISRYLDDGDLNHIASALEMHHLEEASDFGHRYPLSILPIIDYVLRKRHEVDRIRIIAVSKQHGIEDDEIEELVGA